MFDCSRIFSIVWKYISNLLIDNSKSELLFNPYWTESKSGLVWIWGIVDSVLLSEVSCPINLFCFENGSSKYKKPSF